MRERNRNDANHTRNTRIERNVMSERVKQGLSYFFGSRNYPLCNNAVMVRVSFLTPPLFPCTQPLKFPGSRVALRIHETLRRTLLFKLTTTYSNLIKGTPELPPKDKENFEYIHAVHSPHSVQSLHLFRRVTLVLKIYNYVRRRESF